MPKLFLAAALAASIVTIAGCVSGGTPAVAPSGPNERDASTNAPAFINRPGRTQAGTEI